MHKHFGALARVFAQSHMKTLTLRYATFYPTRSTMIAPGDMDDFA
jgi:hypothetical protein